MLELDRDHADAVLLLMVGGPPNRIAELRNTRRWSQQQLADACEPKTTQPQIDRLERGERKLTQDWMTRISKALGASAADLLPKGSIDSQRPAPLGVSGEPRELAEPVPLGDHVGVRPDLPVYGFAAGSEEDVFFIDQGAANVIKTARPNVLKDAPDAYAVDVYGESMSPKYEPGNRLWVYPRRPVKPGDDVVVQFQDGRAMVKRLVRRTETQVIVRQFNPTKELKFKKSEVKSLDLIVGMLTILT